MSPPSGSGNGPQRPADARALARATLVALDDRLAGAASRSADPVTRAHFEDLRPWIAETRDPDAGS